jgi:hypothetical protein
LAVGEGGVVICEDVELGDEDGKHREGQGRAGEGEECPLKSCTGGIVRVEESHLFSGKWVWVRTEEVTEISVSRESYVDSS